jgi:hypothetical protein
MVNEIAARRDYKKNRVLERDKHKVQNYHQKLISNKSARNIGYVGSVTKLRRIMSHRVGQETYLVGIQKKVKG